MANIMMVVNKALSSSDLDALKHNMEVTYKTPVVGIIPLSEEIVQLGSRDIFCLHHPDHALSLTVNKMATKIIKEKSMLAVGG